MMETRRRIEYRNCVLDNADFLSGERYVRGAVLLPQAEGRVAVDNYHAVRANSIHLLAYKRRPAGRKPDDARVRTMSAHGSTSHANLRGQLNYWRAIGVRTDQNKGSPHTGLADEVVKGISCRRHDSRRTRVAKVSLHADLFSKGSPSAAASESEAWVVQTGDPNGNGTGGPGYILPEEPNYSPTWAQGRWVWRERPADR